MAKKKTVKRKKPKKVTVPKKSRAEEFLEILIGFSDRANTGRGSGLDEFFVQQSDRLKKQLEDLKKA